jgi:thiamine biosynthesis protein ThiS
LKLLVNGEQRECAPSISLEELIQSLGLRRETIVAEVNQSVVQTDRRAGLRLAEGDQVELIQFVGGG